MTAAILGRPVSRGKLWGSAYTWAEAIESHASACHAGCCRFYVSDAGIWIEGNDRDRCFRTKLPKGAEQHARDCIAAEGLAQSKRKAGYWVGPAYI